MGVSVALVNGMGSIWMFIFPLLLVNIEWFNVHAVSQFIGSTLQAVCKRCRFCYFRQVSCNNGKLGRVILLGPLLLILSLFYGKWGKSRFPLPWFMVSSF